LKVLDSQEHEDATKRENLLRIIWAIEHDMYQPPKPLPQMADERAKAVTDRMRNQTDCFTTLSIPTVDMEALRQRYPEC
jgi:hypothetical protein